MSNFLTASKIVRTATGKEMVLLTWKPETDTEARATLLNKNVQTKPVKVPFSMLVTKGGAKKLGVAA